MYLYLYLLKKKIGNFYEIKQNKKEQNDYNSWILKTIFPMFLVGGRCQCVFMTLFMIE